MIKNNYGSFWLRLLAFWLDRLILCLIPMVWLLLIVVFSGNAKEFWVRLLWWVWGLLLVMWLVDWAYQILTFLKYGGSIGKLLAGLKIEMEDGRKPTLADAFMRFPIGYFVSGLLFGAGYSWILRDQQRKSFHDHIAGTVVVKQGSAKSLLLAFPFVLFLLIVLTIVIIAIGMDNGLWRQVYNDISSLRQQFSS